MLLERKFIVRYVSSLLLLYLEYDTCKLYCRICFDRFIFILFCFQSDDVQPERNLRVFTLDNGKLLTTLIAKQQVGRERERERERRRERERGWRVRDGCRERRGLNTSDGLAAAVQRGREDGHVPCGRRADGEQGGKLVR